MGAKRKAYSPPLRSRGGVRQRLARRRVEEQRATALILDVGQQMCVLLSYICC